LPFIHSHVAAMPDVHHGFGATVGSVIPARGAIIPAAVVVDIGCGMNAVRLSLRADELPDNLKPFVRGKGNVHSYNSCSHRAGRSMSRTAAKKTFNSEDLKRHTRSRMSQRRWCSG